MEFKHLRVVKAKLRPRGTREGECEQAEHVQDPNVRGAYGLNSEAADIVGGVCLVVRIPASGMMNQRTESSRDLAALG